MRIFKPGESLVGFRQPDRRTRLSLEPIGRAVVSRIIGTIELDPTAPPTPCLSCAREVLSRRCGVTADKSLAGGMPAESIMAVEFVEIDSEQLLAELDGEYSRLML